LILKQLKVILTLLEIIAFLFQNSPSSRVEYNPYFPLCSMIKKEELEIE
jgi:hypothetical protein